MPRCFAKTLSKRDHYYQPPLPVLDRMLEMREGALNDDGDARISDRVSIVQRYNLNTLPKEDLFYDMEISEYAKGHGFNNSREKKAKAKHPSNVRRFNTTWRRVSKLRSRPLALGISDYLKAYIRLKNKRLLARASTKVNPRPDPNTGTPMPVMSEPEPESLEVEPATVTPVMPEKKPITTEKIEELRKYLSSLSILP